MTLTGILLLLAFVAPPSSSAFEWTPGVAGGAGGEPFSARCPEDQYVTGFALRVGDDIDHISVLCARVGPNGTRVGETTEVSGGGGTGGDPVRLECPADKPFVNSMKVTAEGRETKVVAGLSIYCELMLGHYNKDVRFERAHKGFDDRGVFLAAAGRGTTTKSY